MFKALVRGYLDGAGPFLTRAESALIAFSGKLITFTIGIRFLTDFLSGDTYFRVHRPRHNLDRCRTQFKLVESIEQQEEGDAEVCRFALTPGVTTHGPERARKKRCRSFAGGTKFNSNTPLVATRLVNDVQSLRFVEVSMT